MVVKSYIILHRTLNRLGPIVNSLYRRTICLQQTQSSTPFKPVKKQAAKVGIDTFTSLSSEAIKQVEAAAKFDYVKAGQDFLKAFQPTTAKK